MKNRFLLLPLLVSLLCLASSCGYTTKSLLPENIKTIYVMPVKNAIDLSGEISDKNRFRTYRPGLEVDLTNAIMNRFIFDGNLKIAAPDKADAVAEVSLSDYRRDVLRYSEADDIQEYRLSITVSFMVYDSKTQKKIVPPKNITGDATFFLSGSRAISEDEATAKAVEDVAHRVVEQTIEVW